MKKHVVSQLMVKDIIVHFPVFVTGAESMKNVRNKYEGDNSMNALGAALQAHNWKCFYEEKGINITWNWNGLFLQVFNHLYDQNVQSSKYYEAKLYKQDIAH